MHYQSPSPPLYLTDQLIVNDTVNDKQIHLIPHEDICYKDDSSECDRLFVEPLEWMIQQVIDNNSSM